MTAADAVEFFDPSMLNGYDLFVYNVSLQQPFHTRIMDTEEMTIPTTFAIGGRHGSS